MAMTRATRTNAAFDGVGGGVNSGFGRLFTRALYAAVTLSVWGDDQVSVRKRARVGGAVVLRRECRAARGQPTDEICCRCLHRCIRR